MNINKISLLALATLSLAACSDVNKLDPQGSGLSAEQLVESAELVASRAEAEFAGMFTMMGQPDYTLDQNRADDFGFIMDAISSSAESGDLIYPNSGYNWFSRLKTAPPAMPTPAYATPCPITRYRWPTA